VIRPLRAELVALALFGCGGDVTHDAAFARFSVVHANGDRQDYVVPSKGVDCSVASGTLEPSPTQALQVDLHPSLSAAYPRLWIIAKPYPGPTRYDLGGPDPEMSQVCLGAACWKLAWAPSEGVFHSQRDDADGCTLQLERYASPRGAFACQMHPDLEVVDGEFGCADQLGGT
jgi:hypothetical protein